MLGGLQFTSEIRSPYQVKLRSNSRNAGWLEKHKIGFLQYPSIRLTDVISKMGNPFKDFCPELLTLDSRNCAGEAVIDTVKSIEALGLSQYEAFCTECHQE